MLCVERERESWEEVDNGDAAIKKENQSLSLF